MKLTLKKNKTYQTLHSGRWKQVKSYFSNDKVEMHSISQKLKQVNENDKPKVQMREEFKTNTWKLFTEKLSNSVVPASHFIY